MKSESLFQSPMSNETCKHGTSDLVDQFIVEEDDPNRLDVTRIKVLVFECCECGKIWEETE